MTDAERLEHIVKRIVEAVNPHRIYLFGSRARGDATQESDFDLVVVADMEGPRHMHNVEILELFPLRDFSLDVLVYGPDEFEEQKEYLSSPSFNAVRSGKVLYAR
jgi:predicted nucleotidyltransferase